MNLLVCISRTPETTAKISFSADNKTFSQDGVNYIMNPYDEWFALVRAIELKEAVGGEVTVINVGDASSDIVIRKALAIGADKAVRIDTIPQTSAETAHHIATFAKDNNFDIIFTGKETIDYNGSEVGSAIAEMMDLPFISFASKMEASGDGFDVYRDIEGGTEKLHVTGKFVLSASKGLAEQRIPNMRGIMMAKKKPLEVQAASDYGNKVSVSNFELPDAKTGVKLVDPDNMDELVRLLREEAKVI